MTQYPTQEPNEILTVVPVAKLCCPRRHL